MSNIAQKLHDGIEAILGAGGIAYRSKDGATHFDANAHQLDYAHRAASGFCRFDQESGKSALNMLQAATGTGKTTAYLVPLFLYVAYSGHRVAVSTYTRHLQRQILEKDAVTVQKWVEDITGVKPSIARRLGKFNYVSTSNCELAIRVLLADGFKEYGESVMFLRDLIDWADQRNDDLPVNSGVLDDYMEDRAIDFLPTGVTRKDICLNSRSGLTECATYLADVQRSKGSDVVVVNHALMVMNANRWASLLDDQDDRPISVAVFDEADRLEDAAASVMASDVAIHRLLKNADKVSDLYGLKPLQEACKGLSDFVMAQKVPAAGAQVVYQDDELARHIDKVLGLMGPLANAWRPNDGDLLSEPGANDRVIAEFVDEYYDLLNVKHAMTISDNSALLSWSPVKEYPSLRVGRPNQGRILSRLWSLPKEEDDGIRPRRCYLNAALFTSATLTVPGKPVPDAFDFFANTIGALRHPSKADGLPIHNVLVDLLKTYQPRKFGEMSFMLADPQAPNPSLRGDGEDGPQTDPKWLDYCATVIRTAKSAGGRVLVLTLSWADTIALSDRLEGLDGLMVHKRGDPLRGVISQYKATEGAVLLSPGAWEGVDLPGQVDQLVITRIPFSPPNRPDHDQERIHLIAKGYEKKKIETILRNKDVIATRRKLEQGVGRGLRAASDKVTLWFADPRFPYPEGWAGTFDPILMAAPVRNNLVSLRSCIAQRFVDQTYPEAKLCLLDGSIYSVIQE